MLDPGRRGGPEARSSGPTASEPASARVRCERRAQRGRLPAGRRRHGVGALRGRAAQAGGRRRRSCSSGASPSRPTSGRRCRRSTCAARRSARTRTSTSPTWYEENDVELLDGTNVMSLDAEARTAKLQGGEEVEFDKALVATGANVNILRARGRGAGGDPLPARVRQLRRDPRGRGERRPRRADRRQLHRLRGGGVADREGEEVHDRDDGGRGAVADVRRGGRGAGSTSCSSRRGSRSSAGRSWRRSRATGG